MISAMDFPTISSGRRQVGGARFADEVVARVFAAARQHEWRRVQHSFQVLFLDAHTIGMAGAQHEKRAEQAGAGYSARKDDPNFANPVRGR
jgi:bisphosphoglycerate-independent phosphoglycerate mutase (AlkP superfamily)